MRPLSAAQLLSIWEAGLTQPAWQRALSLLGVALPDISADALAHLPVGQRDAYLLDLRESLFGPQLTSLANCPSCGERLELSFAIDNVRSERLPGQEGEYSLEVGETRVAFRLPNSLDLAEIAGSSSAQQARQRLLTRCILSAETKGKACAPDELPDPVKTALVARLAALDPQGDVQIDLSCPACAHQWQVAFDILSYLWSEINAWAQRMLREVHLLARAYGWSESDILALSPGRRGAYLQMILG